MFGSVRALRAVEQITAKRVGVIDFSVAVPQEADHAVAADIRASLTARAGDATVEPQLARGVVEQGVAGDDGAEAPGLDTAHVDLALDPGNASRLLPGLVAHLLVREAGQLHEDDLGADRARLVAH